MEAGTHTHGDGAPQQVTLRPGTPVMLREPGYLQVGLSHPASRRGCGVRVPDSPEVRRLLDRLRASAGVAWQPTDHAADEPHPAAAILERLDAAGLLVDVPGPRSVETLHSITARAQFGRGAEERLAVRTQGSVAVEWGPALESSLGPVLMPLLSALGLRRVPPAPWSASVHLVVADGVLDREATDRLMQASIPHLPVSGDANGMRVGPFVDPGRTACVRCVDAHEALQDPRRPLLLAQAARSHRELPPPRDAVLDVLALAWAARDLARFVEGDQPSTWSTTADLEPRDGPSVTPWGRHPDCGCAWASWLGTG